MPVPAELSDRAVSARTRVDRAGSGRSGERHEAALALADGVDVLIHDAQHRAEEFADVGYLGHASVDYALAPGTEARVGTVVLFHHAPSRIDDEIDAMLAAAENRGVAVVAADEGLVLDPSVAGRLRVAGRSV